MRQKFIQTGILSFALAFGFAAPSISGGHSPVEKREAAMSSVGKASKTIGEMLKGTTDFDAASANAALVAMREASEGFSDLYPAGTEGQSSNKFLASEKVWTDAAGFTAENAKFQMALDAAISANPADKASLAAAFGTVGGSCKSCHQGYRIKNE